MRFVRYALLLVTLLAPTAHAAGFGCYGKLSRQERVTCGAPVLSAVDYRLNAV